jgi:hypothetical protein
LRSFFSAADVELLEFLAIVEVLTQRVGLAVVLVQDVEVQGLGPPVQLGHVRRGRSAVHDGTFALIAHDVLLCAVVDELRLRARRRSIQLIVGIDAMACGYGLASPAPSCRRRLSRRG